MTVVMRSLVAPIDGSWQSFCFSKAIIILAFVVRSHHNYKSSFVRNEGMREMAARPMIEFLRWGLNDS